MQHRTKCKCVWHVCHQLDLYNQIGTRNYHLINVACMFTKQASAFDLNCVISASGFEKFFLHKTNEGKQTSILLAQC